MANIPLPFQPGSSELQGIFDHLDELRGRIVKIFLALVISILAAVFLTTPVLEYLQQPYGREFTVLGPTGGVVTYFRVTLLLGASLAMPVITYQLLMFILPGLTRPEKRLLFGSLPAFMALFLIGVLFAWFILIPPALGFLENFQPTIFKPEWTADQYISFVTALIFWMGVAFEMPLIFFVLALLNLITPGSLIRNWRFAIIGTAIAAAMITPTVDPINMFFVMAPLLILYLLSISLVALGNHFYGRYIKS